MYSPDSTRATGLADAEHSILRTAVESLLERRWEEARAAFLSAVEEGETPEALEGLALARWWLNETAEACRSRELAYRLYRRRGDARGASRMAIWLAWDYYAFRGEMAVANGWLQRARRLLDGVPLAPEHGWLKVREGELLLDALQSTSARRVGAEAAKIGRDLGVLDLEMLGLSIEGLALVLLGEVERGMAQLDEATAAAVVGEFGDPFAMGEACCMLIFACEVVRDHGRASQWCAQLRELANRSMKRSLLAVCCAHYAAVLVSRGEWAEAEVELESSARELADCYPQLYPEALVRLGELRRRQGRLDEAERLFHEAEFHPNAQIGSARITLERGDPAAALDRIERLLRHLPEPDVGTHATTLEVRAESLALLGEMNRADEALDELDRAAAVLGTEPLRAAAAATRAIVARIGGDHDTARRCFEDALVLHTSAGTPFEAAEARLGLALALHALGRHGEASAEARGAHDTFEKLDASTSRIRAASLISEIDGRSRDVHADPSPANARTARKGSSLTSRELEVLKLVSDGLSNKEIGHRLYLSEHTVHRHVANLLRKLDLTSRTAAAAHAAREGLL
jgi:LuxR family transcriptional regulator, maltose regulon positive regulatory protein